MALQIQYYFQGDPSKKYYTSVMTHRQYNNFKILPAVKKCIILEKYVKSSEENYERSEYIMRIAMQRNSSKAPGILN